MFKLIKNNVYVLVIFLVVLFFFRETIISGLLPIPSDTIVGLYHPFLDLYAKVSPQGVPFQNFLITDPVRQIIPWKMLVVDNLSSFNLPLWNPYEMAGKPLLANFQSGVFYPLGKILLIKPFMYSWSVFIIIQPLLTSLFMFAYLKNLKLNPKACLFGAVTFAFSGFSLVWMEWGNIGHTALWLPLILLSVDRITNNESRITNNKNVIWSLIFLLSLTSSFFAGHLQTFFYLFILSFAYLIFRWFESGKKVRQLLSFIIPYSLFIILTFIQWPPTLRFINLSTRSVDQNPLTAEGWFIPFQNLVQFIAPDFFGNPATLNYWGVWNYAEFAGYIGVIGLFFAFLSFVSKRRREIIFFGLTIIISLIFALPTFAARIPFVLSIPFLSSAQPTRLLFLVTFALSVLSAFGFNAVVEAKKVNIKYIIGAGVLFGILFSLVWLAALGLINFGIDAKNLEVAKRNLIFPTGIFGIGFIVLIGIIFIKEEMTKQFLILALIVLAFFDLFRFGSKFTPFTNPDYFYPSTSIIQYLQDHARVSRFATTDSRILAPNIATYYKLHSIEGYDPLYLKSYAELIAASEREDHSIKPPFGFNRIVTPRNMDSPIIDLLNVTRVLTFSDITSEGFEQVYPEGNTKVYANHNALPRAFFVEKLVQKTDSQEAVSELFNIDLSTTAVTRLKSLSNLSQGEVLSIKYEDNKVSLRTENEGDGFLVLSDVYYPTWKATIDGKETKIHQTNYAFRGVFVPKGTHVITFYDTLF